MPKKHEASNDLNLWKRAGAAGAAAVALFSTACTADTSSSQSVAAEGATAVAPVTPGAQESSHPVGVETISLTPEQSTNLKDLAKATLATDIVTFQNAEVDGLFERGGDWTYAFAVDSDEASLKDGTQQAYAIKFGPEGENGYRVLVETFYRPQEVQESYDPKDPTEVAARERNDNGGMLTNEYFFDGSTPNIVSADGLSGLLTGELVAYNKLTDTHDGTLAQTYVALGELAAVVHTGEYEYSNGESTVTPIDPSEVEDPIGSFEDLKKALGTSILD